MFRIMYGTSDPKATGVSLHRKRKGAEQIRRWWLDNPRSRRAPGSRWAVIEKVPA